MATTTYGSELTRACMETGFCDEHGKPVFYVRPYSEGTRNDLKRLLEENPLYHETAISESNGTYRVRYTGPMKRFSFMESFWGMLFRRFMSEAKSVCIDPVTDERYYGVIFSKEYITPQPRKLAA